MGNEASIHLRVEGAEQAKAALDSVSEAGRRFAASVGEGLTDSQRNIFNFGPEAGEEGQAWAMNRARSAGVERDAWAMNSARAAALVEREAWAMNSARDAALGLAKGKFALAGAMRILAPEIGMNGELMTGMLARLTMSTLGVTGLIAALMGGKMVWEAWTAAQKKEAEEANRADQAIAGQTKSYNDLTASIRDAIRAKAELTGKPATMEPTAASKLAVELGAEYGASEEIIKTIGAALGEEKATPEEAATLADWMTQGGAAGKSAKEALAMLRSRASRGLPAGTAAGRAAYRATPEFAARRTAALFQIGGSKDETALAAQVLRAVAAAESAAGRQASPEDIERQITDQLSEMLMGPEWGMGDTGVIGELVGRYPELGGLRAGQHMGSTRFGVIDTPSEAKALTTKGWLTGNPRVFLISDVVNQGGTVIFQSGRESRAGRPTETVGR